MTGLKTSTLRTSVCLTRTCCRCGLEFSAEGSRICGACRKSGETRTRSISHELSFRERQIAELVCEAKLNKEIAFALSLTEGTIKEYLNRIYRKLQIKNRTELAMWTVRNLRTAA